MAFVAASESLYDPAVLPEAVEVTLGVGSELDTNALIGMAADVVQPGYYMVEESGRFGNWSAAGLQVQDLVVAYSLGVASGLTVEFIKSKLGDHLKILGTPPIDSGTAAWAKFEAP